LNKRPVTADVIREVCQDFDFPGVNSTGSTNSTVSTIEAMPLQETDPASKDELVSARGPWRRFFSF